MATAPAEVNECLQSVTGSPPPNTELLPAELRALSASKLDSFGRGVEAARKMLVATGGKLTVQEIEELKMAEEVLARVGKTVLLRTRQQ